MKAGESTMSKTYRSGIAAAMHETVSDLHEIGLVDEKTMCRFDESCLTTVEDESSEVSPAARRHDAPLDET